MPQRARVQRLRSSLRTRKPGGSMQILVNSDNHIKGGESANERVAAIVQAAVERFQTRITRIEVHLSDTNGPKHGAREKRAVIEARVAGLRPVAVAHEAETL